MPLACGIVGLPNVGKSTLFSAITHNQVLIHNYPFTTIEPNIGTVAVPDERLTQIAHFLNPEKIIPATINIVDIAGLIKGSHQGEGLGNQFLAHIREVDAVIHLVRCFASEQVSHVNNSLDPLRDIEIVQTEIILKDLETVQNRLDKIAKQAKAQDKEAIKEKELLESLALHLDKGEPASTFALDEPNPDLSGLISSKPVLYVGNVNEDDIIHTTPGSLSQSLTEWAIQNNQHAIIISAELEYELAFLEDASEREFLMKEWNLKIRSADMLIKEIYRLLDLITFYTTESNHVQAWSVKKNTTAPKAGGIIHSDFERGFIKAEVYSQDDLMNHKSEAVLKEMGLVHTHGKDYLVQDGDIVRFKFSV